MFLESIIEDTHNKVLKKEKKYGFSFFFTSVPVSGFFKFSDELQIREISNQYLKMEQVSYRFPFIVEFKYDGSTDRLIDHHRREKKKNEIFYLLNILLRFDIFQYHTGKAKEWALIRVENSFDYKLSQIGFNDKSFTHDPTKLSDTSHLEEIPIISSEEYLKMGNIRSFDEKFTMGSFTKPLMQNYSNSLSEKSKELFQKASYWLYQASMNSWQSQSLTTLSLSIAIETLLPQDINEKCSKCGMVKFGLHQKFKNFLDQYFPYDVEELYIIKKTYYNVRSKIAHGLTLLNYDKKGMLSFNPLVNNELNKNQNFYSMTKSIILKWLDSNFEKEYIHKCPLPVFLDSKGSTETININPT